MAGGPETAEANAEFIVRAVNNHDDLVKALDGLMKTAAAHLVGVMTDKELDKQISNARAALTRATKE